MGMNDILKAAFENIERMEKEQAEAPAPAEQDSSAAEVDDATVEELFKTDPDETDDQPADMFTHVADAAAPLVRNAIQVKGLDEKAVLVQMKRHMFGTSRRDEAETEAYGAGNVVKHLFQDKTCRMATVKSAYYEVYRYVNDNTVPWAKGVRMLNIEHYFDFSQGLRSRIEYADRMVEQLVNNWDYEVQKDLDRLTQIEIAKNKPSGSLANPDNYPHASEIGDKFGIDIQYMPVPTAGDFRVAISDEDKASLQRQLEEAEDNAARHVLEQMLTPMQRAAEKLAVPIGQEGSVFRDSLIDNIVEVVDRMERVNVSDDCTVAEKIADLKSLAQTYADNKDVLRNSQTVRDKASKQISDLMGQMASLV
jgi:hypothetical protein